MNRGISLVIAVALAAACGRVNFDSVDAGTDAVADASLSAIGQRAYIKASNTRANAVFGVGMALSADGSTLAVGAPQETSNATGIDGNQADASAMNAGAVYVFVRAGRTWIQQAYIKGSNTQAGDNFGVSVSLSADGSTLAVGAYLEDSSAAGNQGDNSAPDAGAVYVFTRSGTTWTQQAFLKAANAEADDRFGDRVALSDDGATLAVSAYFENGGVAGINGNQADNSAVAAGAVYVFTSAGSVWSQQAYIKASNPDANDLFGYSIALSGDGSTLAVGAEDESSAATGINGDGASNAAASAGAVYVYARAGTAWSQQAYVKASNTAANDIFGIYVALSTDGSTLAVGAYGEDSSAQGANGDQTNNLATNAGATYLFSRTGGTWTQDAYLKPSNTGAGDAFGASVALSSDGATLAVGAFREASAATGINGDGTDNSTALSGAAYVFTRAGSAWMQTSYVKASNTGSNDQLGLRVALSASGGVLAVCGYQESSRATGVNGDQSDNSAPSSGAVYVFE